ncbi:MAG: hypothetical protein HDS75_07995 [Bacteroidales bacterium]|nr:hypothetical protein [Bacteroidales bacterium]
MKKYLILLIVTIVGTLSSSAQSQVSAKYQGEVELGYSFGVGTLATDRINLHSINGVKVGDYFSAGIGLGLDYYRELYDKGELLLPIYVNAKGYVPVNNKVAPFLSVNLGYGIGLTEGLKSCDGMLWAIALGVKIQKFKVQLGYTSQRISEHGIGIDMNAVQLGIGIVF